MHRTGILPSAFPLALHHTFLNTRFIFRFFWDGAETLSQHAREIIYYEIILPFWDNSVVYTGILIMTSIPDLFLWHASETGSMPRIYQPRWPFTTVIGNKNSEAPQAVHFSRQIFYLSYFPFAFFL